MKDRIQRFLDHYKAGLITPAEFISLVEQVLGKEEANDQGSE